MEFIKNYNNNAALVKDDQGQEWIVTGKGVGFGLKPGMQVPEAKIERRFASEKDEEVEPDVVAGITPKAFEATDQIVKKMADEYQLSFTGYQYFALADHIDFAVKRTLDGGAAPDGTVAWEGAKLFAKEYRMAQEAVEIIEEVTHIEMAKSEAIYLMYHFINAESDGTKLQDTVNLQGKGFETLVEKGQSVQPGQELIKFDLDGIQKQGYDLTSPVVITNSKDYESVKADLGPVEVGQNLLELK